MGSSASKNKKGSGSIMFSSTIINDKLKVSSKTGVLNISDERVNSSVWSQLPSNLKSLDISGIKLKELPSEILVLTNLKTLHASRCSLPFIGDQFHSFISLKNLNLSRNNLTSSSIGTLPSSVINLDLSFNRLQVLPTTFSHLVSLVELNVDGNGLRSLEGIGALVMLESIKADDNDLTELPLESSNLAKLRIISLKRNKFERVSVDSGRQSIPSEFLVNTAVENISLDGNIKLRNGDVMSFDGINVFLERRKRTKDKNIAGGGGADHSLFGLD